MHAPAGRANALGEPLLERGLPVFVGQLDLPRARRVLMADGGETVADRFQVRVGQQLLGIEHLRVRDRRAHVVLHEPFVQRVVVTGRIGQHALIELDALVPEPRHQTPPICFSAAESAFTSATISVPAPSLVNTSARMPSGDLYDITCTRRTPPLMASSIALALGNMPSTIFFSSRRRLRPAR